MSNDIVPYLVKLYYANCGLTDADVVLARSQDEARTVYEPVRKELERLNREAYERRGDDPDLNGGVTAQFIRKELTDFVISAKK